MSMAKQILVFNGSASAQSSNGRLVERFVNAMGEAFDVRFCPDLKSLPHFDADQTIGQVPDEVVTLRNAIEAADAVLICTPEYVFSVPSGVKNMLEWCVAATVFSDKPVAVITASASGEKGHEELQMILRTLGAKLEAGAMLLISGVKVKIDQNGEFTDAATQDAFERFVDSCKKFFEGY
jgi:chromate reductase